MGKWVEKANKHAEELLEQRARTLRALFPQGEWVEFNSPLFGRCSGRVIEVNGEMLTITEHSVLKEQAEVPVAWVINGRDEKEEIKPPVPFVISSPYL